DPLITEKSCLKCHGSQGYKVGDIRGGLSVSVLWKPHADALEKLVIEHRVEFGSLWFFGTACLILGFLFIRRSTLSKAENDRILMKSQKKYYDLVESTPDLITIVDIEGRIVFVNHSAITIFGIPPEECIGKMAFDFIHPEDREDTINAFEAWLKSGEDKFRIENRQIGVDGQEHLVIWAILAERDEANAITGFVSTGRDITEYNTMAIQLRHNEKMQAIGQLAGGVAHDFNNQLGGILNFAELAKKHMEKDSKEYSYMKNIISGVLHSAELTKQLLAFARKGKYVVTIVDVNEIIIDVTSILTHSVDKKINILHDLHSNPMTVSGDASQLQNTLLNIGLNSRDAMPNGGELSITTDVVSLDEEYIHMNNHEIQLGEYIRVIVKDTGEGMDSETLQHMFEPFYTTKELGKGTGMGMASVYGTIMNHNGAIEVDSAVGEGTTITIFLPFIVAHKGDGDAPIAQVTKKDWKILVVDDVEMLAMSMKMALVDEGYEAIACGSGKEAIQIFEESWQEIDLILLDMIMPDLNGKETYQALKKIDPGVKVLLLSGYSITEGAQEVVDGGALGFLQKPVFSKDLFKKITEVLS
ncbi:MAG: response regulator, partial [Fibrobacterales bacterium]